jgi:hypothetical protein
VQSAFTAGSIKYRAAMRLSVIWFHLATAYAPLTKESLLRKQMAKNPSRFKLVEAARHSLDPVVLVVPSQEVNHALRRK